MKLLIVVMPALLFWSALQAAEPELWILSGQSNACGRGKLPGPTGSPLLTAFNPTNNQWVPARDPLPGMGSNGVGPWVAAATEFSAGTGRPVRLAGFAQGGQSIKIWNGTDGTGWKQLAETIGHAGKGAGVFLWYQGESDCGVAPETYQAQFKDLVGRVRQACGSPKMLAVVVQIATFQYGYKGGPPPERPLPAPGSKNTKMGMRETQRRCVIADGNAILVTALGREKQDDWHLSSAGQCELGHEIGRALAAHLAKGQNGWPGPVMDAAVLEDSGRTVVAHFAEAKKLSGVAAADFALVESDGQYRTVRATAVKAEAGGKTLIRLSFEAPVKLPALLVYGAGDNPAAQLTDEAGNRAPAVQLNIVSGKIPGDRRTTAPNGAGAH